MYRVAPPLSCSFPNSLKQKQNGKKDGFTRKAENNMKISPYLKINRIEFIVTYQCTGKCIHCSIGDRLNYADGSGFTHIEAGPAADAVKKLSERFNITSVMAFGGEPLLYPEAVYAVYDAARSSNIENRQLITNGYFTKNSEYRKQVADSLIESGLNYLLLSVDAFHQADIPLDPVYDFAGCAAEIPNLRLHPAWVIDENHENPYNAETKKILKKFKDLGIQISSGNNIFMAGNAVKYLSEYYPTPDMDLSSLCGSAPYTDKLTEITSLSLVPNGDVMVCDFVIGNIYRESIDDIISHYDPYQNKLMRTVLEEGMSGLKKAAEEKGIPTEGCYSICDLCRKLNRKPVQSY